MAKWFCTTCRSYLGQWPDCSRDHASVDLERPDQRQRLASMVWKRRYAVVVKVTRVVLFVAIVSFFAGLVLLSRTNEIGPMMLLGAIGVLFLASVRSIVRWMGARWIRTVCGADAAPPEPTGGPSFRGVVRARERSTAPLTGRTCAGSAVELTAADYDVGPVLARIGQTAGFELVADDGTTVQIPRGAIRLHGSSTAETCAQPSVPSFEVFGSAAADLCPADGGIERIVQQGARLELFGTLEPVQVGGGYRDGVWSKQPVGMPILRVVDDAPAPSRDDG